MLLRTIAFIYYFYVIARVGYQISFGETYPHDTEEIEKSWERFKLLDTQTKVVVVVIGVPAYTFIQVIPMESANLAIVCRKVFYDRFLPWFINCTTHVWHNDIKPVLIWCKEKLEFLIITTRDLCGALWPHVRKWIVDKLYKLYDLIENAYYVIYNYYLLINSVVKNIF